MPLYSEVQPIHQKLPDPNVGEPVVQGAYDSMWKGLKAKASTPDLQLSSITTDPADGIDPEKQGLIDTLNAEHKAATTASATIEHWEETEALGAKTDDKAKIEGGIVVDAGGKRTGEFYWKDSSGAIHGPEQIVPAYAGGIRGLRRQKAEGDNSATLAYDALRNGDAVRVVFTKTDGTQDALTLQKFDEMIGSETAKRWDADTAHKIKFADLQKKHPNLAHAYARKIEDEIAKNAQYSFHHLENKTNTAPKPEEKDPDKRAEYAFAAASEIENVSVVEAAKDLSKVKQNYSFGLLAQYNRMLKEAMDKGNTPLVKFLTPLVTSAARECFEQNPQVFDRNHNLLSNLDLSRNYYEQHGDLVSTTIRDILVNIGIPPATAEQIRSGLHPHRLVALITSMSQKTAENPRYVGGIIKRLTTEGILDGEEGNAIETMCNHGWLSDFRKSLAAHLGVKPEQLQNPEDFMKQHVDDILKDATIQNPNDSHKTACYKLTDYTNEMLGKPTFNGFKGRATEFFQANLGKIIFIGMGLGILQGKLGEGVEQTGAGGQVRE